MNKSHRSLEVNIKNNYLSVSTDERANKSMKNKTPNNS